MDLKKENILITGVAGFVGSRLAEWISENHPSFQVIGIDDLSSGFAENIPESVNFQEFNLLNQQCIKECFEMYRPRIVFHFAAYAAEGLSPFIRTYNYRNNLLATAGIVNQCINFDVQRLVFTSSMAVYGHGHDGLFREDQTPEPIDPYGVAKYASEMDIQIAGDQHNLDWCILRPHNLFGRNQNVWDMYRNVIGIWMNQYLNGKKMTIYGDGEQKRAFSYINDCLEPLWKAGADPRASGEIINLGGLKKTSVNELNRIVREVTGGGEVVHLEARHEVKHAIPSHEKSVQLLDYKETTNLKNAISMMWDWVKSQSERSAKKWDEFEVEKKVYPYWK